jgi:hypothetical protein
MKLSTQPLIALILLTTGAFGLLTFRHVETSILISALLAVLCILILTASIRQSLTRSLAEMTAAVEVYVRDESTLPPRQISQRNSDRGLQDHSSGK